VRTDRFVLVVILVLLTGAPITSVSGASSSSSSSASSDIPFSVNSHNGTIGEVVVVNGTGPDESVQILFGGISVATAIISNGSFLTSFAVPLLNTGNYSISISSNESLMISKPQYFEITYGIDNMTSAIRSIQSLQGTQSNEIGQLLGLLGLSSQLAQISSAQNNEASILQNLTKNESTSNPSQATNFQQNLIIYLSIVTVAALAVMAFSIYSLYRLKKRKFEELEIIESG
jgi:hypothetical protein